MSGWTVGQEWSNPPGLKNRTTNRIAAIDEDLKPVSRHEFAAQTPPIVDDRQLLSQPAPRPLGDYLPSLYPSDATEQELRLEWSLIEPKLRCRPSTNTDRAKVKKNRHRLFENERNTGKKNKAFTLPCALKEIQVERKSALRNKSKLLAAIIAGN
ncbi:hypothetical protein VTO42DRAFT_3516 [Malbranchea cinnamomea]